MPEAFTEEDFAPARLRFGEEDFLPAPAVTSLRPFLDQEPVRFELKIPGVTDIPPDKSVGLPSPPEAEQQYKELNNLYRQTLGLLHPEDLEKRRELEDAYHASLKQIGVEPVKLEKFREGGFIPQVSSEALIKAGVPDAPAKIIAGTEQAVAGFVDGVLANPELFALPALPKAAQQAYLFAFGAGIAKEAPHTLIDFADAVEKRDLERATRDLAQTGIGAFFLRSIGRELTGKAARARVEKESGKQLLKQIEETPLLEPDIVARNVAAPGTVRSGERPVLAAPRVEPPPEAVMASPGAMRALQEVSLVQRASPELIETAKLVAQRQQELGRPGKLEFTEHDFQRPMPGFRKGVEERMAARGELTGTRPLPEPERGVELRDVEQLVRERLERRDWHGAVNELASLPARAGRDLVDKLTGVSRESVPLASAERTIFNEIWDASVKKLTEPTPPKPTPTPKPIAALAKPILDPKGKPVLKSTQAAPETITGHETQTGVAMPAEAQIARSAAIPSKSTPVARPWDLIDELEANLGGKISISAARELIENFRPTGAARRLFSKDGRYRPDVAAQAAENFRRFDSDVDFLESLNEVAAARKAFREGKTQEQKLLAQEEKQAVDFYRQANKPGPEKDTIISSELMEGDQFQIQGAKFRVTRLEFDEFGEVVGVVLDDGRRFGTQRVGAHTVLQVDKDSLRVPKTEIAPKLRQMEKQGDLLSTQAEPFALAGEKGVDFERIKAEREAKDAKIRHGIEGTGRLPLGIVPQAGPVAKALARTVADVAHGIRDATKRPLVDPYSTPMLERLESFGGVASRRVAAGVRQMDSRSSLFIGQLSPLADKAILLASKAFRGGTTWIRGLENVTENAAISRLHLLEGTNRAAVTQRAPAHARELAGAFWDVNMEIGRLAARASVGFAPSGKVQRILTPRGMDAVLAGRGLLYDRWVEGTAVANNKTPAQVRKLFEDWKAELDKPVPDVARLDSIAQDFHRQLPRAITHVRIGPSWIELLESDPVHYVRKAGERTARAVAFREVYPPDNAGRRKLASDRQETMREIQSNARGSEFDNLIRTAQGHRLDQSPLAAASVLSPMGTLLAEAAANVARPLKAAMLTKTAIVNISETLVGGPAVFMKFSHILPLLWKNPLQLYKQAEMNGAVNRAVRNFAFNPSRPAESVSRMLSEGVGRVTFQNLFNELQEFTGAGAARIFADRVRAKALTAGEKDFFQAVLRAAGFRQNARAIVEGKDLAGLQAFERQAGAFLSAGNQRPLNTSRWGNSRAFNALFWFHRYPQMVLNQFRGIMNNLLEDVRTGNRNQMWQDSKLLTRFLGYKFAQGFMANTLLHLIREGDFWQLIREAREDPAWFVLSTYAQAIGGPLTFAMRLFQFPSSSEDVAMEIVKMSPPITATMDALNAIAGAGKYEGLESAERARIVLESKIAIAPVLKRHAAIMGLTQDDPELRSAIRAYYRWGQQQGWTWPKGRARDPQFSQAMRGVVREMESGGDWQDALTRALEIKGLKGEDPRRAIASSLRGRIILRDPHGARLTSEQIDSLVRWIGEKNLGRIQERDAMIDALAELVE